MQFESTKTYENLAKGFAGECQAGMRYQFLAKQAQQEGLFALANIVKGIAKNETVHARVFYEEITRRAGKAVKIGFEGDYPFWYDTLEENLAHAARGEAEEHLKIYPAFAAIAKEEGFASAAKAFEEIAKIEKEHEAVFGYLYRAYKDGSLYSSEEPQLWICSECGYAHTSKEAWKICPVCKREQGYVQLHLPQKEDQE